MHCLALNPDLYLQLYESIIPNFGKSENLQVKIPFIKLIVHLLFIFCFAAICLSSVLYFQTGVQDGILEIILIMCTVHVQLLPL